MPTTTGPIKATHHDDVSSEATHTFDTDMQLFVLHATGANVKVRWATGDDTDHLLLINNQKETRQLPDMAGRTVYFIGVSGTPDVHVEEHLRSSS